MMRYFNKYYILLFLIIFIAAFLRFYKISVNPPSLTWDEVAWGYNAYSLGLDGRDEFGRFLPYDYLESYGDFKPPLYAYLDIIPVKIFGLNEFATRFPSAFFGTLTVVITFFLAKRLFKKDKHFPFLASFLLAISPWHINLSRVAFEANISTFLIVLGVWLFLFAVQSRKWILPFSAVSFALTIYTFNSARVFVPLFVLMLSFFFYKNMQKMKKEVIVSILIGILMILPILKFLLSPQASLRFKEVNIFSDPSIVAKSNQEIRNDNNRWWAKIINNRRVFYSIEFFHHYFDNLNPDFLFIKGDGNPKFSTQDTGELYAWEVFFVVVGFLYLFKKKEQYRWVIVAWILLGIVPAATARETPHALRIETVIPVFQLISAYGVICFFTSLKKGKIKTCFTYVGVFVVIFNFLYYYHGYHNHSPREYSREWQYGYKESINYVMSVKNKYSYVAVTEALGRPYMYYLFYSKFSPQEFRRSAVVEREAFGFVKIKSFDRYYFDKDINTKIKSKNILYIDLSSNAPGNANIIKRFYLLNNDISLVAYTL